jgi:hypothetical protein
MLGKAAERLPANQKAEADKPGIVHHVEDVGELRSREGIPEIRTQSPFDVLVSGKPFGRLSQDAGQRAQSA